MKFPSGNLNLFLRMRACLQLALTGVNATVWSVYGNFTGLVRCRKWLLSMEDAVTRTYWVWFCLEDSSKKFLSENFYASSRTFWALHRSKAFGLRLSHYQRGQCHGIASSKFQRNRFPFCAVRADWRWSIRKPQLSGNHLTYLTMLFKF